jgi:hypothetical protein
MTYIVARASPEIGFMISDTLVTPLFSIKGQVGPVNGQYHALKIQIFDGDIAVGFSTSNDVDFCLSVINAASLKLGEEADLDVSKTIFEEYQAQAQRRDPRPDCEFLVLQLTSTGKKLAHVTWDKIRECGRAYIGDPAAHKRASALRVKYEPPKTQDVQQPDGSFRQVPLVVCEAEIDFMETRNSIDTLVSERRIEGVGAIGGLTTVVVDARISKKLEYMQAVERGRSPEEGVFGYSLLAANEGKRGIALYFDGGSFGYIMPVGDANYCYREEAATLDRFIVLAKEKYGLTLTGGTCSRAGSGVSDQQPRYSPTSNVQYFRPDGDVAEARP